MRWIQLLLFLALASPAVATDGVLEINQTCAVETGCFPGDGAGFPITINQAGSYRLTGNLMVASADTTAIDVVVANANVSIDLGGFTIRGITTCSGVPITNCAPLAAPGQGVGVRGIGAVRVRNGLVTQMGGDGVQLVYSGSVQDVRTLLNGGDGIHGGEGAAVRDVEATSNGDDGIDVGFEAVVSQSLANGNKGVGILVLGGSVVDNVSSRNGKQGANLGTNTSFHGNQLVQNTLESVAGGKATGGNVCDDGKCTRYSARRYYQTIGGVNGANAQTQCDPGFHMASMWEISEPGALAYAKDLGLVLLNSGSGPPVGDAWVLVGDNPSTSDNCNGYASAQSTHKGTSLRFFVNSPAPAAIQPTCDSSLRVWCVED